MKYLVLLSILALSCGDRVVLESNARTCGEPVIGMFKASCILKDSTDQYVLINEHPEISDNLLELPGDVLGVDETPQAAVIRGVKQKTELDVQKVCFVFNTGIANIFNCDKVEGVGESTSTDFLVVHRQGLESVNWK
jgi:hypothetical protein